MRNFNKGYDAYTEGVSKNENPYGEHTIRYDDWNDGWDKACEEAEGNHLESGSAFRSQD